MSFKALKWRIKVTMKLLLKPFKDRRKSEAKRFRSLYASYYNRYKVKDNVILYESYAGRGMICNPYAIFKAFMKDENFSKYVHVWVLDNKNEHHETTDDYKKFKNVIFVSRDTKNYAKFLTRAKYLINNVTFPYYFTKKPEQTYINTWHSITVKLLGYDMPDGRISSANVMKNFLCTDYLISANKFTTRIFKESYKLNGLYEGKIIENGHPRNDLVLSANREYILDKLSAHGIKIDRNKKIILYAPTWKGSQYSNPKFSVGEYLNLKSYIEERIDIDKYQVLIKPHQAVYQSMKKQGIDTTCFVPTMVDTNELLSVVDILISDYSSIYFDYMVTDRPVLFYIPDLEEYEDYRGIYFKPDELPGPATKDIEDIADWINNIEDVKKEYNDIYQKTKSWACEYDDGNVSKKIIDIVFKGNEEKYNIISDFSTKKKKILMYGGPLVTNGVTYSLLSLLNNIDYNKFDITILTLSTKVKERLNCIYKVNTNARVLARVSTFSSTLFEDICDSFIKHLGLRNAYLKKIFPDRLYEREYRRCIGDTNYDYVVDFSGYAPFWGYVLMQDKGAKKIIWQHTDLNQDKLKYVKGKQSSYYKTRKRGLEATVLTYPYYDKVVACGESVMKINRENLATKETWDRFTFSTNTINFKRTINGMKSGKFLEYEGEQYYVKKEVNHLSTNPNMQLIKAPSKDNINFVTIGRLSPEKNHRALIDAFAKIYEENNNCRLYIIGEGDLKKSLRGRINKLNLKGAVFLTGALSNPFAFMKRCDCFVFPSKHEGQPLTIVEARMLGLPIIVSDFSTVHDSLIEDGQLLIGMEVDDIYNGMKAFIDGKVPANYKFDPHEYNKKAYSEFEALFD